MTETRPDESAIAAIEQSNRRQHFTDVRHVTVRWEPYKPDGQRQMRAKGRWQEQVGSGDFWSWQNCQRPAFAHDPQDPAPLMARIAELEARLEAALDWMEGTRASGDAGFWEWSLDGVYADGRRALAKEPTE